MVYLAKTMSGDFIAGKLDTTEVRTVIGAATMNLVVLCLISSRLFTPLSYLQWRLVLAFAVGLCAFAWAVEEASGGGPGGLAVAGAAGPGVAGFEAVWRPYARLFPLLFAGQLACEVCVRGGLLLNSRLEASSSTH